MAMYIVARRDKLLYHFGILISSNKVLHYASKTNNMFASDQMVRCDYFNDFAINREVCAVSKVKESDEKLVLYRANNYWGNYQKYSLRNNNCIFFILWCLQMEGKRNFFTVMKYYVKFLLGC